MKHLTLPLLLLLLMLAAPAGADPEIVGHVATLSGRAVAQRPGEPDRILECRDPIFQGDRVVTADRSRVGILVGDLLAHVSKASALQVAESASGARLALEKGAVRVIDPRGTGAHARLAVLDTGAQILGNDLEGYIFTEKTGGYAMLCEWDAPLPVNRDDERQVAQPGQCVIAKPGEPLYSAQAHDERLGSPDRDRCPLGVVAGGPDLHLSPTDVAAGPPLAPWSAGPAAAPPAAPSPCDVPGSGCQTVFEPPPIGGVPIP
jgi:hypothetical protein